MFLKDANGLYNNLNVYYEKYTFNNISHSILDIVMENLKTKLITNSGVDYFNDTIYFKQLDSLSVNKYDIINSLKNIQNILYKSKTQPLSYLYSNDLFISDRIDISHFEGFNNFIELLMIFIDEFFDNNKFSRENYIIDSYTKNERSSKIDLLQIEYMTNIIIRRLYQNGFNNRIYWYATNCKVGLQYIGDTTLTKPSLFYHIYTRELANESSIDDSYKLTFYNVNLDLNLLNALYITYKLLDKYSINLNTYISNYKIYKHFILLILDYINTSSNNINSDITSKFVSSIMNNIDVIDELESKIFNTMFAEHDVQNIINNDVYDEFFTRIISNIHYISIPELEKNMIKFLVYISGNTVINSTDILTPSLSALLSIEDFNNYALSLRIFQSVLSEIYDNSFKIGDINLTSNLNKVVDKLQKEYKPNYSNSTIKQIITLSFYNSLVSSILNSLNYDIQEVI